MEGLAANDEWRQWGSTHDRHLFMGRLRSWSQAQYAIASSARLEKHNSKIDYTRGWVIGDVIMLKNEVARTLDSRSVGPYIVWAQNRSGAAVLVHDLRKKVFKTEEARWVSTEKARRLKISTRKDFLLRASLDTFWEAAREACGQGGVDACDRIDEGAEPAPTFVPENPSLLRRPNRKNRSGFVYTLSCRSGDSPGRGNLRPRAQLRELRGQTVPRDAGVGAAPQDFIYPDIYHYVHDSPPLLYREYRFGQRAC